MSRDVGTEQFRLPTHVQERLNTLRAEADSVKQCFTQFSFHAFAFSAILIGLIAKELQDRPYIGMVSPLLCFLLLLVTRVGNYKYNTANRNYGYELHLYRTLYYRSGQTLESTEQLLNLGWEEAMFAWRIVQATMYDTLYKNFGKSEAVALNPRFENSKYKWWDTNSLRGNASHHPGSYLHYMHIFLHRLAIAAVVPAAYSCCYYLLHAWLQNRIMYYFIGAAFTAVTFEVTVFVYRQIKRDNARRAILEAGLLSIQACAVVWRCAAVAHFRALGSVHKFMGYTRALGGQACELAAEIENVHEWLQRPEVFPITTFSGLRPIDPGTEHISRPELEGAPTALTVKGAITTLGHLLGVAEKLSKQSLDWVLKKVDDIIG